MRVTIDVVSSADRPPAGAPVIVQLRDTSLQDAAATILAEKRSSVRASGDALATVNIDLPNDSGHTTVWAHVDVDGDGQVSKGDYVTKQSFPLRETMRVTVSRVG